MQSSAYRCSFGGKYCSREAADDVCRDVTASSACSAQGTCILCTQQLVSLASLYSCLVCECLSSICLLQASCSETLSTESLSQSILLLIPFHFTLIIQSTVVVNTILFYSIISLFVLLISLFLVRLRFLA